jgi:hypothetical protein
MDDDELPGFQDILAHLRTRGTQVDPKSGRWKFRIQSAKGERLIAIEHQSEPDADGWIYVRVSRGDSLAEPAPMEHEREIDVGGLVVYEMPSEIATMIPFETIESLADFDRALDRVFACCEPG